MTHKVTCDIIVTEREVNMSTQIRVSDELRKKIRIAAANMGCTMGEVINIALDLLKKESEVGIDRK